MKGRIEKLRFLMKKKGIDCVIISNLTNIRYFSGFSGSSAHIIVTLDDACFLTDSRYITQVKKEIKDFSITEYKKPMEEISLIIERLGVSVLGFEGADLSYEAYKELEGFLSSKVSLRSMSDEIDDLRMKKEATEIQDLEQAARVSSQVLWKVIPLIKEGVQEREIAIEIDYQMRIMGAERSSFDTIVISGDRSALPHGKASTKKIDYGDLIIVDFGCIWRGYNSDETCTFCLGRFTEEQEKIYNIVKDAHDRALDVVMPGVEASDIDRAARETIEKAGYGDFFGHGTGHGVGLSVHEKPRISPYSDIKIEEGMVFTVEPAIYIPGWGGVRIEDTILVTSDGCRILTMMPKDKNLIN